ncbi:MAG TPA: alpha/beta hydrolase [Mycobacteriales bacterium]
MLLLHALGRSGEDWDSVMPAFARDYRVIAPDLRGHGASSWPGDYSFEAMRDDTVALLGALGIDQVVVVGHSMGGAVGWLLALSRPERVRRLVVEDAPPPFARESPVRARPEGPLPFDWDAIVAVSAAVNDPSHRWWKALPELKIPTLVVAGGPTSTIPQDTLAAAAALVPKSSVVTIPVGHHVHSTRPDAFSDAVLTWLREA